MTDSGKNVALPNLSSFKKVMALLAESSSFVMIKFLQEEMAVFNAFTYSSSQPITFPIVLYIPVRDVSFKTLLTLLGISAPCSISDFRASILCLVEINS